MQFEQCCATHEMPLRMAVIQKQSCPRWRSSEDAFDEVNRRPCRASLQIRPEGMHLSSHNPPITTEYEGDCLRVVPLT